MIMKQRIYIDTSIVNLKNGYATIEIRNPKDLIISENNAVRLYSNEKRHSIEDICNSQGYGVRSIAGVYGQVVTK
jgi:hypothetical protein